MSKDMQEIISNLVDIIEMLCGQNVSDNTVLEIKNFRKIMQTYQDYKREKALVDFDEAMTRQQIYKTAEGRAYLEAKEGDTHHGGCGHCN